MTSAHGHGRGVVDAFATNGMFLGRVATHGALNAPWGLAWAPADFGRFSNDLLVGNFGDGRITAYRWDGKQVAQGRSAEGQRRQAGRHRRAMGDRLRWRYGQ